MRREEHLCTARHERAFPHVAIIMNGDGSGIAGGKFSRAVLDSGMEATKECVRASIALGVSYLTLCGPTPEIGKKKPAGYDYAAHLAEGLNGLDLAELDENNVRLRFLGSGNGISLSVPSIIGKAVAATRFNTGLQLTIAMDYSARDEILRGVKSMAARIQAGGTRPEDITEASIADCFESAGFPDPDLFILTNGRRSLSDVLLWQCAYSEFLFIEDRWTDFTRQTREKAIAAYGQRNRRFGGVRAG